MSVSEGVSVGDSRGACRATLTLTQAARASVLAKRAGEEEGVQVTKSPQGANRNTLVATAHAHASRDPRAG